MKSQMLTRRYVQGLINTIRDRGEFESLSGELQEFSRFLGKEKKLLGALTSAFLPTAKKMEIATQVLEKTSLKKKIQRFILLMVENNRLFLLEDVLKFLPVIWNEEHGISTFEVRSVVPLQQAQKKRLEKKLSHLEERPVSLSYTLDPSLIGGLSIRKGNIVYDVSLLGDLERLRQKIHEG
jgi:F-type H+-transporting ATPase subunit delta